MPPPPSTPASNLLVAALPAADRHDLLAACEQVPLTLGEELYEPGKRIRHVFFPTRGFISLITPLNGHPGLEIGLVGSEGMVGTPIILGVETSRLRALVQGEGEAWRMDAARVPRILKRYPTLQRELNRYLYVILAQLTQAAACTRFHFVEPRLARWLLMTRDRGHSNEFHVTHEQLAAMLGVRRSGITQAARSLQKLKLINYSRGDVEIVDEKGLEAAACSCYAVDSDTYASVLT